jgi:RND family efflux transporter MFP subunit
MVLAALPLVFMSAACSEKKVAASTRERIPVRVYRVSWAQFTNEQRYAATTEPATQLDLAFQTAGVVTSIYRTGGRALEPGDRVPAGAVLAQLRVAEYQARSQQADAQLADAQAGRVAADASVREAQAAMTQAQSDLERSNALFEVAAMTRADLDAVRARHDAAEARLAAARTNIESFDARINAAAASRNESRVPLSDTTIRATFPAVVVARKVEQGGSVVSGTVAYTLADLRSVKLTFGVTDRALAQFAAGTKIRVDIDALPGGNFSGRVLAIAPEADPSDRLFRATAAVENSAGSLKAGMVASVTRTVADETRELGVPLRSIRRLSDEGGDFGVLVIHNETAQIRKVTLGPTLGAMIAVRSGLEAGDLVAEDAGTQVRPGDPVQPIPTEPRP